MQGIEALIRWRRPDGSLMGPSTFLPIAETSRLISAIGAWAVGEACEQASRWSGANPYVSINVSQRELIHDDVVGAVAGALQASSLSPHRLVIEVTETALVDGNDLASHNLTRLRSLGIRVALDNFGTWRSSLANLRRLPAEVLKIDRALIADVDTDQEAAAVVGAVITMSHALGLYVIAHGVERASQLDMLTRMGCDAAQGFHLGVPKPASELGDVVRRLRAA